MGVRMMEETFLKMLEQGGGWAVAAIALLGWTWERKSHQDTASRHTEAIKTFTGLIQRYSEIVSRLLP